MTQNEMLVVLPALCRHEDENENILSFYLQIRGKK